MKLSIITIGLNNREGYRRTIESVLRQTWRDFEFVIVDGASTDGSVEVIKQFELENIQSSNPIFFKWISEPDKGIYNAMNKGTLMATGDYCLYLNSGDWLYTEDTLQKVFELPKGDDIFWGKMLYCASEGVQEIRGVDNINVSPFKAFSLTIPHQSSFIKRSLLLGENKYDETLKIAADHKFFYKSIFVDKCSYAILDDIISVMDGTGISSNIEACRKEDEIIFCEFFPSALLKDYQDWLKMKEKIHHQEQYIHSYSNAIAIYDGVKNKPLLRKTHTLIAMCFKKKCNKA